MLSTYQKIIKVTGLLGTGDLSNWEEGFVAGLDEKAKAADGQVIALSDKQLDVLERLHDQHFA